MKSCLSCNKTYIGVFQLWAQAPQQQKEKQSRNILRLWSLQQREPGHGAEIIGTEDDSYCRWTNEDTCSLRTVNGDEGLFCSHTPETLYWRGRTAGGAVVFPLGEDGAKICLNQQQHTSQSQRLSADYLENESTKLRFITIYSCVEFEINLKLMLFYSQTSLKINILFKNIL